MVQAPVASDVVVDSAQCKTFFNGACAQTNASLYAPGTRERLPDIRVAFSPMTTGGLSYADSAFVFAT